MALRVIKLSRWAKLNEASDPENPRAVNGPSPGGVAAELGISRQAVHKAIRSGLLDAVKVVLDDDPERMVMFIVTPYSVRNYKLVRQHRANSAA